MVPQQMGNIDGQEKQGTWRILEHQSSRLCLFKGKKVHWYQGWLLLLPCIALVSIGGIYKAYAWLGMLGGMLLILILMVGFFLKNTQVDFDRETGKMIYLQQNLFFKRREQRFLNQIQAVETTEIYHQHWKINRICFHFYNQKALHLICTDRKSTNHTLCSIINHFLGFRVQSDVRESERVA